MNSFQSSVEDLWTSLRQREGGGNTGVTLAFHLDLAFASSSGQSSIGAVMVIVGMISWDMSGLSIIEGVVDVDTLEEFLFHHFQNTWPIPTLSQ